VRPTAPGRPRLPVHVRPLALLAGLALGLTSLGLPAAAGAASARAGTTPTRISSWSAPASVDAGAPVQASATVASAGSDAGRRVGLQRRTSTGWTTVSTSTTDSRGRVRLTWRTSASTSTSTVQLRVSVSRSGTERAVASSARSVEVVGSGVDPTYPAPEAAAYVDQTLDLVNAARAQSRRCGTTSHSALGPLSLEPRLGRAAEGWATAMGEQDFFEHVWDGSTPDRRIEAEGYRWSAWGENIAAGYGTPAATVAAWLKSPGHCRAIMNGAYTQVGVGYAVVDGSRYHDYWVLDFGHPR